MVRQQASNLIAYVHRGEQMNTTDCLLYNLSSLNTSCSYRYIENLITFWVFEMRVFISETSSTYQINLKLILFKLKRDKQNLRHLQNISPSTSILYVKVSEMTPWKIVIREDTKSLRYKFDFLPTAREVSLRNSNIAS